VAGLLLVSVPVSVVLGFVMANWSAQTSVDSAKARAEAVAQSAAVRISDFVAERRAQIRLVARNDVGELTQPDFNARLVTYFQGQSAFDAMQVYDQAGRSIAVSSPGVDLTPTPTGSTFANSLSVETTGSVTLHGRVGLDWIMTAPIVGSDSKPQGVVVGDLNVAVLGRLINPYGLDVSTGNDQEMHLINAQHLLLYTSAWGVVKVESEIVPMGALSVVAEGRSTRQR